MRTQDLLLLAGALLLAACDSGYSTSYGGGGGTTGHDTVHVVSNHFNPTSVIPDSTGTVVWTWNSGGTVHNVVFEEAITGSGDKSSGTFSHTFAVDGTYHFRCTHHSSNFSAGMVGVVKVGVVAADTTAPPDPY